jgi:predicted AlkP superfamily phosphohydrolase/phosphomutase
VYNLGSGGNGVSNRKALVIGLDGATFDLMEPLIEQGLLPNISSLRDRGYSSILRSTVPPISATAWTSLITGVNPGKHGILQFVNLRPNQGGPSRNDIQEIFPGGVSLLNADRIQSKTLWQLLSDAGKRQVVINVPMTYPPRPLNGVMVAGMMTPPSASIFTYPPHWSKRLLDTHYEIDLAVSEKEFDFNPGQLIHRLHELMTKRTDVALDLMQNEPWDFFMVVFTGTDRLQHRFWKYMVPGYPEYHSPEAVRLRPRLEQYFRNLDQAVAQLVTAAGPDTTIILLSDHGFGPVSERTVHRLSMMRALGLTEVGIRSGIVRVRNIVEAYLGLTPDQVRKLATAILPRKWVSKIEAKAIDAQLAATAKDLAYSVTLDERVGGIYINRDRLSVGVDSYEIFRQEIISNLKKLVDPDTKTLLVAKVYTREELYSGPALAECPDLVFYLTPGYGLSGGVGPGGVLVSPRRREPNQQGTHRDEGILLIHGPNVNIQEGVQERLVDVTATILYVLDVPILTTMDSRPILAAFDQELVAKRPPRYVDMTLETETFDTSESERWISEEDADQLLERLRGLGYIE